MKSIDDALELRGRILGMFELAEASTDPADIERLLTFVVVGAGPTGVEMAGQIAELAHRTLRRDFRNIDPHKARIVLLDAAPAVLPAFGDKLGGYAVKRLEKLGVDVQLGAMVTNVDATGIEIKDAATSQTGSADPGGTPGGKRRIESVCKVWAAGVQANPLGKQLAEQSGAGLDRAGRIEVEPDLTLPGHPEVYVVGDMISLNRLPGVAQVAIQGGRHAARDIRARINGRQSGKIFKYHDKGSMATISRFSAVASIGRLKLTGFLAWLMWLAVHLVYIIGFKHRVTTLLHWAVSFVGRGRSERTVTHQQIFARTAISRLGENFAPTLPPSPDGRPSWSGNVSTLVRRPAEVPGQTEPADAEEPEPAASSAI